MKREDDQELWDLLDRQATPELSPFFARNVVRQVRTEAPARENVWHWLQRAIWIPTTAVAVALLAAGAMLRSPQTAAESPDAVPALIAQLDPADFEVVADLDILLASEEEILWEDT
ncbi:MAG: hypothetical protein H0V56_07605 [Chthoniobacterales bacterium]|nr:hypothetical protein [Chthoniobacterales bacterium]